MIYDPKKPIAPPSPAKDSPRVRDGVSHRVKAMALGSCSGCGKPYEPGEEIVEYTPLNKTTATTTAVTEMWHSECWSGSNSDFFDRPKTWPWK